MRGERGKIGNRKKEREQRKNGIRKNIPSKFRLE